MGLFSSKSDLGDVVERVEKLERRMKDVEMQWETWYEKARRLLWRLNKRFKDPTDDVDTDRADDRVTTGQPDVISARILERRKGRGILPR